MHGAEAAAAGSRGDISSLIIPNVLLVLLLLMLVVADDISDFRCRKSTAVQRVVVCVVQMRWVLARR